VPAGLPSTQGNSVEAARFSTNTANYSQLKFLFNRYASGSDWTTASTRIQCATDVTNQGYIEFNPPNGNYALAFGSGSNELVRINSNGNAGIGVSNPAYKLDLYTAVPNDGMRLLYNNSGYVLLQPNSLGQSSYNNITQSGDAGLVYGNANYSSTPSTSFGFIIAPWASTTSGLRLDQNGNVGIGTANTKGYQLAVNGSAIFTKAVVKLYPNWPDYVFKKEYHLPSLDSVAAYIQRHQHLPEMPSADSVAKDGLDLGSNQAALLKKIEELTLYLIQQEHGMQKQNQELQQLRKQNQALQEDNQSLTTEINMLKSLEERITRLEKQVSRSQETH